MNIKNKLLVLPIAIIFFAGQACAMENVDLSDTNSATFNSQNLVNSRNLGISTKQDEIPTLKELSIKKILIPLIDNPKRFFCPNYSASDSASNLAKSSVSDSANGSAGDLDKALIDRIPESLRNDIKNYLLNTNRLINLYPIFGRTVDLGQAAYINLSEDGNFALTSKLRDLECKILDLRDTDYIRSTKEDFFSALGSDTFNPSKLELADIDNIDLFKRCYRNILISLEKIKRISADNNNLSAELTSQLSDEINDITGYIAQSKNFFYDDKFTGIDLAQFKQGNLTAEYLNSLILLEQRILYLSELVTTRDQEHNKHNNNEEQEIDLQIIAGNIRSFDNAVEQICFSKERKIALSYSANTIMLWDYSNPERIVSLCIYKAKKKINFIYLCPEGNLGFAQLNGKKIIFDLKDLSAIKQIIFDDPISKIVSLYHDGVINSPDNNLILMSDFNFNHDNYYLYNVSDLNNVSVTKLNDLNLKTYKCHINFDSSPKRLISPNNRHIINLIPNDILGLTETDRPGYPGYSKDRTAKLVELYPDNLELAQIAFVLKLLKLNNKQEIDELMKDYFYQKTLSSFTEIQKEQLAKWFSALPEKPQEIWPKLKKIKFNPELFINTVPQNSTYNNRNQNTAAQNLTNYNQNQNTAGSAADNSNTQETENNELCNIL